MIQLSQLHLQQTGLSGHQGSGLHRNIVSVYRSKSNQVAADKAGRQFSVVAVLIAVLKVAMHQSKVRPWQHSGP